MGLEKRTGTFTVSIALQHITARGDLSVGSLLADSTSQAAASRAVFALLPFPMLCTGKKQPLDLMILNSSKQEFLWPLFLHAFC